MAARIHGMNETGVRLPSGPQDLIDSTAECARIHPMGKVIVIRHSNANYPLDELTSEGTDFANNNKERFVSYSTIICSTLKRSQQTAIAFGYDKDTLVVDDRLQEFEVDFKSESPEAYVREVHLLFAKELYEYGQKLLEAIKEYGEVDSLIVSHNAVMSAAYFILTGEVTPFKNLSGFEVEVNGDKMLQIRKIDIE